MLAKDEITVMKGAIIVHPKPSVSHLRVTPLQDSSHASARRAILPPQASVKELSVCPAMSALMDRTIATS